MRINSPEYDELAIDDCFKCFVARFGPPTLKRSLKRYAKLSRITIM